MTPLGALWWSFGLVAYAYVGYPLFCLVRAKLFPIPIRSQPIRPRVSIIIAAWREAKVIAKKLDSLAKQSYPAALTEVVIACDGSDDGTPNEARAAGKAMGDRLKVVELSQRSGKPSALNRAVAASSGEILVFTDARQRLSPDAVELLVSDLGDDTLGAVGGKLVLEGDAPVGAYWKYESALRALEGRSGSTVGVSGALYAMRRSLFAELPPETILDDLLVPARVRLQKMRVAYNARAQAFDAAQPSEREFGRKVRTLSGNFQLLLLEPALLVPFVHPSFFDFLSHKLLRLVVPYFLIVGFVASALLAPPWNLWLVGAQLAFYAAAGLSRVFPFFRMRIFGLAETVVVLNAAAIVAFLRFLRYGRKLPW